MTDLSFTHADSIQIDRSPTEVYDLVSDVTRTGEWSPICVGCEWDEGDGPAVGAHFTGHNEVPGRTWSTRSEVVEADPGQAFAWQVGGGLVKWGYRIEPAGDGSQLTEWWEFTEAGRAYFAEKFGESADAEIADRTQAAHQGIPETLAAIRRIAEGSAG